jgi:hypothetical protein
LPLGAGTESRASSPEQSLFTLARSYRTSPTSSFWWPISGQEGS